MDYANGTLAVLIVVGLGDIGIYCHDISWQKISWYYYISRYFQIMYIMECIIVVHEYICSYTLHEVCIYSDFQ